MIVELVGGPKDGETWVVNDCTILYLALPSHRPFAAAASEYPDAEPVRIRTGVYRRSCTDGWRELFVWQGDFYR